ncbi:MAG TPA: ABC transporter permease, partial [Patescibacteria group bacterium]|nr:ABC transporter permease [Patescibacteria group bacterium]
FDLEKEIREWKKGFGKYDSFEDGLVADMELHLRDAFSGLKEQGLSDGEAFQRAVKQVGTAEAIAGEYHKNRELVLDRRAPWRPARFMPALLLNYIKVALRKMRKQKGYAFINIFGLAIGLACTLFILLWLQYVLSFDRFHANAENLYRVEQEINLSQGLIHVSSTPYPIGPILKAEIPEIIDTTRKAGLGTLLIRYGENAFYESRVSAVDPQIFRMFTFPLLQGDPATALLRPGSLVITEAMAKKYFGSTDPLGKAVTINNTHAFTVTAVLKNIPPNSSLSFDMLVPFEFVKTLGLYNDDLNLNYVNTFAQLHAQSKIAAVGRKITELVNSRILERMRANPETRGQVKKFQGMDYLLAALVEFNRPALQSVKTFAAVALFVLLIACINFMNLATARSVSRAKEIGLRKVVGAQRKSIIGQFYGESILTAFLAGAVSLLLVILLLPAFNTLSGTMIAANVLLNKNILLGIFALTLTTGIAAGTYPAFFLSSSQPVNILKGGWPRSGKSALLRKTLVVFQFSISILLLIGMGVVSRQFEFMRNTKLGYDKEQLIYLPMRGEISSSYAAFKEQLNLNPGILDVSASDQEPTFIRKSYGGPDWDGKDPDLKFVTYFSHVDFDYPETLKIEMVAGRTFSRKHAMDNGQAFLVNEEIPKLMGLDAAAAVGKRFKVYRLEGTIIGVMKNFHYSSLRYAIAPLLLNVDPNQFDFAIVRLKAGEVPASLKAVKETWRRVFPQYPIEYHFFDEDFGQIYQADEQTALLLKVFAGLAVIIACLGLHGLASYTAEQRTKEIGIRKIMGASSPGIILLLLKEFAKWVLIANLLAWPIAYLLMQNWLQEFAFRSTLVFWLFALAGTGALALALLTVSLQAFRAARANPVDSLRYE